MAPILFSHPASGLRQTSKDVIANTRCERVKNKVNDLFLSVVQIILPVLGLEPLKTAEMKRLNELKGNQNGTLIQETGPPGSPGHRSPSPPPLPQPPKDLDAPTSPISKPAGPKHFPLASPIIGNSRSVRFAETESKQYSFLNDSSVAGFDDNLRTSTPLKSSLKPSQGLAAITKTKMPSIAETCEIKTAAGATKEADGTGSEIGHSTIATINTIPSQSSTAKSFNDVGSTSKSLSKVSPSTLKKLKQFAFVERPTSNDSKQNKENLNKISSPTEHGEKDNNTPGNKKSSLSFEIETFESLSGISSNSLSQMKSSKRDVPMQQEHFDASSMLRTTHLPLVATNSSKHSGSPGQLERACDLVTKSVIRSDTENSSSLLRTGNGSHRPSENNSPTGFSKLLSYCKNASPVLGGTNSKNATNEKKICSLSSEGKQCKNVQAAKRKVQDASHSLFKLNDDDNLSDSDIELDWNPLAKKKKM